MNLDYNILINGQWKKTKNVLEVFSPYNQKKIGQTYKAEKDEISAAINSAQIAFEKTKIMPVYERSEKILSVAQAIKENKEEFAQILSAEAGKPIKQARAEVERAIFTFTDAAEEAKRIRGERFPLDLDVGSKGRWAMVNRFPIGIILGITPFNFPLNLVCHKVAPAMASGNTIILKPASQTPFSTLRLAQEIEKAGWPAGGVNVLPMDSKNAITLIQHDRIKMITFTGSPVVGKAIKNQAGYKRVTLELGGNAGVIINYDADLEYASTRCVIGGFSYAGQSCISVQRIYVHQDVYNRFMALFLGKVNKLKCSDPANEITDVGPMIHSDEYGRVSSWIEEANKNGAKTITGGRKKGNVFLPTVLTDVKTNQKVSCQEVFAPLVVVSKFSDFDAALHAVNDSDFGLQAGLFTNDAKAIFKAYDTLEVGGLIVGDVPTYRIDHMPYGGVKSSGMGREGVRYAIDEMTEPKLLVMNL
jgi:acyl-CoA reductase-like NAD-dependent aldehyde dehydrogenase